MEGYQKVCPFCNLAFDENEIQIHIGIEHLGIAPEDFERIEKTKSPINQEIIQNIKDINAKTIETTSLRFQCEYCEKSFLTNLSLQKHQKFVHSRSKNSSKSVNCDKGVY